jgi:surface antigen
MKVMKKRSTTPVLKSTLRRGSLIAIAAFMVAAAPIAFLGAPTRARDFDAEIRAVQNQIDQYNAEASRLSAEASTLQNKIAQLDAEKAGIQAQVDLSQTKYDQLIADIKANEKKIANNQQALGKTMADMYVDNDISPLEMLASSNNIADYIDKQTQRSSVRDSLSRIIAEIKQLKAELEEQKTKEKQTLDDLTNQRNALAAKQAEQQKLLDDTKGQEAAYQQLSAEGRAKREQLEREQQIAIAAALAASGSGGQAVAGDPNHGGYPDYLANSDYYNPIIDPWGMYSRQCVSYTAWKVYQKNGYMPYWGGRGNANQWPGSARADGYATGSTPRAGSVGVISAGYYGHVVWVESVNANGTINISQYNEYLPGQGWGYYSERYNVNPSTYDTYIYF